MVLVALDLLGTLVLQECQSQQYFNPRMGAIDMLRKQRRLGWQSALFADEERPQLEQVLLKSGLAGSFTELHSREDLDGAGLKNLSVLGKDAAWTVLVGDEARDLRAARKYGASFVKVPTFESPKESFDFIGAQELIEAIILEGFNGFRKTYGVQKIHEEPSFVEYGGKNFRVKVYLDKFEAYFY